MATQAIEEYLPKTAEYINHIFDIDGRERGGHHNYVVQQYICNLSTPICDQSTVNHEAIDISVLKHLKYLDT
jgi:hypothetical protein